jgi:7-cyano-7-deazaguanine synthase
MARKIGVLFSGGLDSAALVQHYLVRGYEIHPVFVEAGLPWEKVERYWTNRFFRAWKSPHIKPVLWVKLYLGDSYRNNWSKTGKIPGARSKDQAVFLPARNLMLLSRAMLFLAPRNVTELALGTLGGNPFADARPSYFKLLNRVFSLSMEKPFRIHSPFRQQHKKDLIAANKDLPLHLTFSCINPQGKIHCGTCNKCAERKKAFKMAGVDDKTKYKS